MSINRNWRGTKTERNETIAKEGSRQAASSSSTPGLETELARGPLRRARETSVPTIPSPAYRYPLSPRTTIASLPLHRSRPCRRECVFPPCARPCIPHRAGLEYFRVGREQGGGRWTRYIADDVCVVPVAQQWNRPYARAFISPLALSRFHFLVRCAGLQSPCTLTLQRSSRTVSQEKRLTSANPGSTSGGGQKGAWRSWWRCKEARGNGPVQWRVNVYTRQWINIGAALNSPGPKWFNSSFNPAFYLRFDIRLYIVGSFSRPFFYTPCGNVAKNRRVGFPHSLLYLVKIGYFIIPARYPYNGITSYSCLFIIVLAPLFLLQIKFKAMFHLIFFLRLMWIKCDDTRILRVATRTIKVSL